MTATILEKSGFNRDRKLKIVGTSPVKHDGIDKVTGRAKFGADLFLPGMLVVHHSDFDVLIPSHSRIGKLSGGTRISMLLGTPG